MLLYIFLSMIALAGVGGTDGERADYWDRATVLYANVTEVRDLGRSSFKLQLQPIATLTGKLDSAMCGELMAAAYIESPEITNIRKSPAKRAKVIVLVEEIVVPGTRPEPGRKPEYMILNGNIRFFPLNEFKDRPALFEVTDFDDPKVTETIENLRKLRGKQHEEAEKAKAAQKPAAQKQSPARIVPAK